MDVEVDVGGLTVVAPEGAHVDVDLGELRVKVMDVGMLRVVWIVCGGRVMSVIEPVHGPMTVPTDCGEVKVSVK